MFFKQESKNNERNKRCGFTCMINFLENVYVLRAEINRSKNKQIEKHTVKRMNGIFRKFRIIYLLISCLIFLWMPFWKMIENTIG